MEELPKKLLVIRDCTFILPEGFEGSTEEAFAEFLEYQKEHVANARFGDALGLFSSFNMLVHSKRDARVCGEYAILELSDGKYVVRDRFNSSDQPPEIDTLVNLDSRR